MREGAVERNGNVRGVLCNALYVLTTAEPCRGKRAGACIGRRLGKIEEWNGRVMGFGYGGDLEGRDSCCMRRMFG